MSSPSQRWTHPAREPIRRWVLSAFPRHVGGAQNQIDYDHPHGDHGLFGPDSAVWRVHSDFPGMLAGGLAALMLQTLHPLALAGVWDHSNFRDDLLGRLRRTTAFVGGTAYAPREQAEALIEHVRQIHTHVHGHAEDGRPYAADDPDLLTWVHVTEAYSFLQGYRQYSPTPFPASAADRYYDETRRIAEALGARHVPRTEAEIHAYLHEIQAELEYSERSLTVLRILSKVQLPVPAAGLTRNVFLHAGAALLPPWATTMLRRSPLQQIQSRLAAHTLRSLAPAFRAALKDGIASRACLRVDMSPDILLQWR